MKLILLGAPGAGKGTQAEAISKKLGIPTISTGNMIREALQKKTEMGLKAKVFMDAGNLVPDEVVIGIVRERLMQDDCADGFILDGFPRTIPQAQALDEMDVDIEKVIEIYVEDEKIIQRMGGRRVCEDCGASYHLEYKPSKADGICDVCDGKTVQRADDKPETVLDRLAVYSKYTRPLKDFYDKKGILHVVHGQEEVKDTIALTMRALEE